MIKRSWKKTLSPESGRIACAFNFSSVITFLSNKSGQQTEHLEYETDSIALKAGRYAYVIINFHVFYPLFELVNLLQKSTKKTILTFDADLITHRAGLKREAKILKQFMKKV